MLFFSIVYFIKKYSILFSNKRSFSKLFLFELYLRHIIFDKNNILTEPEGSKYYRGHPKVNVFF
jgi:hypothetical protein